ncbi:MAG: hypothetical protein JW982_08100 [Spirochaetes bacterium]|nr:hypothetical protein [Spirochaetota bacterium]
MKKIILFFGIFLSLFFVSCEVNDTGLKIRVSSIPPQIVRLHFVILNGEKTVTKISVAVSELSLDGSIEIYTQTGKNRQIILWAENDSGAGEFFGSCFTDIAGINDSVNIRMISFLTGYQGVRNNLLLSSQWNDIPGAVNYILEGQSAIAAGFFVKYIGTDNYYYFPSSLPTGLRVHCTSIFGINSTYSAIF